MTEEKGTAEGGSDDVVSKAEYEKALELNNTLKMQLTDTEKKYEGIDLSKYEKFRADSEALRAKELETARNAGDPDQFDAAIAKVETEASEKITAAEQRAKEAEAALKEFQVVDKGFTKFSPHIVDSENAAAIIKDILRKQGAIKEGELVFKDKDGNVRRSPSSMKNLSIDELLDEVKSTHPFLFKSTVISGGKQDGEKSSGSSNGASVRPPAGFNSWSPMDQQRWYSENPNAEIPKFSF